MHPPPLSIGAQVNVSSDALGSSLHVNGHSLNLVVIEVKEFVALALPCV
jgi:hypothetical protein